MTQSATHLAAHAGGRGLALGLAALCAPTTAIAFDHVLRTAQRGVICGMSATGGGHCWACYAAPLLALAAIISWRVAEAAPSLVRVRR